MLPYMLADTQRLTTHAIFTIANWTLGILLVVVGLFFLLLPHAGHPEATALTATDKPRAMAVDRCIAGALALSETIRSPLAFSLEKKLILLAQSVRPDWSQQRAFRIGVRGTAKEQIVCEGEPLFCLLTLHSSGGIKDLSFDPHQGDITLIPEVVDNGALKLHVTPIKGDAFEIVLRAVGVPTGAAPPEWARKLGDARWWGRDAFFAKYGGEVYGEIGKKEKLAIDSQMLYVEDGDFLTFSRGTWHVLSALDRAPAQAPLGTVRFNGRGNLDLEIWDEKGFCVLQTELKKEADLPMQTRVKQLIIGPKRRTAQGVSCKIGKQRWILKPGDWLISSANGIRKLQTREEIEAYLSQKLEGELVVIDQFDRGHLRGHLVNRRRTQLVPFSIQVAGAPPSNKREGRR